MTATLTHQEFAPADRGDEIRRGEPAAFLRSRRVRISPQQVGLQLHVLLFTDPAWRKALIDWEDGATRMVANLRWLMADHIAEPGWKSLVKRLRAASAEFSERWERHEVRSIENKTKHVRNPIVGTLRLDIMNTWLSPGPGTRLHVYTPTDATSDRRLLDAVSQEDQVAR